MRPNTRPCIEASEFSCNMVVMVVCTVVNAIPYNAIKTRYSIKWRLTPMPIAIVPNITTPVTNVKEPLIK